MSFTPGDRVHLAGLGTGIIRETRGGRRYVIEIRGRMVVAAATDLEPASSPRPPKRRADRLAAPSAPVAASAPVAPVAPGRTALSERSESKRTEPHPVPPGAPAVDLHGMTVEEAIAAFEMFVNEALLAGHAQARVIHGRSGGRLKVAVHQHLRGLSTVASFHVDPRNPGVTIIDFE